MSLPATDLNGKRFGKLTVIKRAGSDQRNKALWLCQCNCAHNNQVIVRADILRSGASKSCGCFHKETVTKHGGVGTIEYKTYREMIQRCHNKNSKDYSNYGGRGIKVCKRWRLGENGKSGFECFRDDVGKKPSKDHVIDRIDNDKGYSPDNCRWATRSLSMINRRPSHNQTGFSGVQRYGKKFYAFIRINGKSINLGSFDTAQKASLAYQSARSNRIAEEIAR